MAQQSAPQGKAFPLKICYNKRMEAKKAENIRNVIRYLQKFKNATVVIYLDDKTIESPLFSSHIRDIALLHEAGIKVVIIPGARRRIDELLGDAHISWEYRDGCRVTAPEAMPVIKMAAFDVSNEVMTSLAANGINAIIGNWVRSRAKGILDGFDFGTAGEIDRLNADALRTVLADGFIPIFPCIGWNAAGRPYNISSVSLAQEVAINLHADKLFYVMQSKTINAETYFVPEDFALAKNGDVPAMNLEEAEAFIRANQTADADVISVLEKAMIACKNGVTRVHVVDGNLDGVLPCEIFSDLGSGTMIYTSNYGKIRAMAQTDIPAVLGIMRPFVESGKLLPRTEQQIASEMADFVVYEIDGGVHACAALHFYEDGQAEIAAVAVDDNFSHMGIGLKLVEHLVTAAKGRGAKSIFIMTTQAADWFEALRFVPDKIESLPPERRAIWNERRNSKVYRLFQQ